MEMKTSTFMSLLPLELSAVDESQYIEPLEFTESDMNYLGEATEIMKKLYTLWLLKDKAAEECYTQARYSRTDEERKLHDAAGAEYRTKAQAVRQLFWIAVQDEFNTWGKESVGIVKGWRIYWSNERHRHGIEGFVIEL